MLLSGAFTLLALAGAAVAETGIDAWLRYAPIPSATSFQGIIPDTVVALNSSDTSPVNTAALEVQAAFKGIFNKTISRNGTANGTVVIGTIEQYAAARGNQSGFAELTQDGYWLSINGPSVQIVGQNERGALYGTFRYLSMLAQANFTSTTFVSNPSAPIRWVNQWDNLQAGGTHGSVERGYGGPSIFWEAGNVKSNLTRVTQYARILASIGVNAVVVNNVNSNETFFTDKIMDGLGLIADAMRPYGVSAGLSPYFATPKQLKELTTFDPLDPSVINWWTNRTNEIYRRVPDFAGYLVKANSEGQPGPLTYNRTLAQGANMFAKALAPHGGVLMFRAFVYDSTGLNETRWKDDRANAAVQFFTGLDGQFDENVVVQIKYGPIDFQVREPVSPLFGYLRNTSLAIELQISQEYLGQQTHLVYLPPLWHTITDFDLRIDNETSLVRDLLTPKHRPLGGYAGVANVGTNQTWLGSHLAMSNLYAFGRLAWNPTDDPKSVLEDWTRLTFGFDQQVLSTITDMSMESWPAYENYTGNLGVQTLTDILNAHFGPDPATQDNTPWGQWTRADADSIGMDRTVSNGTGNAGQYPPQVAAQYENIETTPDDLLLWFHHVPYTHKLKSGKTVIQHFYDAHYAGSATAQTFPQRWQTLEGKIDDQRYNEVLFRFVYQAGHSLVWRDAITNFYYNKSSIADTHGQVGSHPYRIEAESMELDGYMVKRDIVPWITASGRAAIVTTTNTTSGTASHTFSNITAGVYNIAVNYYDVAVGRSTWELSLNDKQIGTWKGDSDLTLGHSPVFYLDGHTATRITFPMVAVLPGDVLKIVGHPDGQEAAPVDYVSLLPMGIVD